MSGNTVFTDGIGNETSISISGELLKSSSFTKRNNTITNRNLHFILLEWYYNKEMAIFMYGNIENLEIQIKGFL
jgi:hypothetical protein